MSTYLKIGDRRFSSDQLVAALVQYQLLEPLIGQILLDDKLQEISLAQEEIFQSLVQGLNSSFPEDFADFLNQWCQAQNITPEYFTGVVLRELRLQKFKQIQFGDRLESEFLHRQSDLDQVIYSVLQLADATLAQELYFQLRDDGVEFAQLVANTSQVEEQIVGGLVGPVPLSSLPIAVAEQFRHKTIGIIYEPIVVADSIWLVRLEQFIAAHLTATTRTQLMDQLYQQWLQGYIQAFIQHPDAIALETQPASRPIASLP